MSSCSVAWLARRYARNSMIAGSNRAWRKNFSVFYNERMYKGKKPYFNWNLLYLIPKVSVYCTVLNWTPSCRFFCRTIQRVFLRVQYKSKKEDILHFLGLFGTGRLKAKKVVLCILRNAGV